ncbi:glycosyltransferase involved in cell wall biosynthesis [Paucibacter oligotrophus]|uniref:Glycosyltransferase involved in cell wall biosynthesis n=1 Tax=Roseateles oligotrophus TaxID=1769250 RepID=A0A840L702_9BURK|nr:glycosyltransferase [Roseateles oligotrophus]MBB4842425.1 glycosyltransferase involved in cell wall biosynthesis [Roseateles oligotrophus]
MKIPVRILHLAKYYPPEQGGMESVTQILAEGVLDQDHAVEVLCFTKTKAAVESIAGVKITRAKVALEKASQPLGWAYFWQGLRKARQADIVHLHAPNLLASVQSLLLPTRTRLLVHWHSDIIGKGLLGRVVRPLERRMLARANIVIATSPTYAASSPLLRSVATKTQVIPIGIPTPPCKNSTKAERDFDDFLRGRPLVLALGRLVPYKGFATLIEAARELPEHCAIIIGGAGPLDTELRNLIAANRLENRILMAGRLSNAELNLLFAKAMCFCLPSVERSEAFGVVLLEAMARGVPCIATTIEGSGTAWVNEHQTSGLNVPPAEPSALAEALRTLLDDPLLTQRLGEGARKRFNSLFSAERFVIATQKSYSQLLRE